MKTETEHTSEKDLLRLAGDTDEIIGRTPSWIIRWGTAMVFIVFGLILFAAWVFRYPDRIISGIVVTSENPPAPVMARVNGKIAHLGVQEKQWVSAGELLAVLQNPADYRQVLSLYTSLDSFLLHPLKGKLLDASCFGEYYRLGEVQSDYARFIKNLLDYNNFIRLNYHSRKILLLQNETEKYRVYIQQVRKQRSLMEKQLDLAYRQFARDSVLFSGNNLAAADFDQTQSALLQKKYAYEDAGINLSKTQIQMEESEQAILELQLQKQQEGERLLNTALEAAQSLKGTMDEWRQKYLLVAPVTGTVTFHQVWSVNQEIREKERVFTIVPSGNSRLVGKLNLPLAGSGKVLTGQKVYIRFDDFPRLEYGMVRGIVEGISLVPSDQIYSVEITLPDSLRTNYGKVLPFRQEMQGTAEIITEDARLIQRIINPLRSLMKNIVYRDREGVGHDTKKETL